MKRRMSLKHLVLYSHHKNDQLIAYQYVHPLLPPRRDILNLVICVRMNAHTEYMYAHEHRHLNMVGAQRQVDPCYISHEPLSNNLIGCAKTPCQRPTGYNPDTSCNKSKQQRYKLKTRPVSLLRKCKIFLQK